MRFNVNTNTIQYIMQIGTNYTRLHAILSANQNQQFPSSVWILSTLAIFAMRGA